MNRIFPWVLIALGFAFSQQASWLDLASHRLGGHGGPYFKLTTMDEKACVLGGGLLAVSTNPGFSWIATVNYEEADDDAARLEYGGLGVESAFRYGKLVQPMSQFQIGYGLAQKGGASGGTYVFEAAGMLGFLVGRSEKLIAGVGYREAEGLSGVPGLTESSLDGWYATARLDYGIFDANPEALRKVSRSSFTFSGFYSGKWTRIHGRSAWLDGGGTVFIFKKNWAVGASGYRSRNDLDYQGRNFSLAYGGLIGRYAVNPMERLHLAFAIVGALGGVGHVDPSTSTKRVGAVPVVDPDVLLEANITEFLRVGIGVGYRVVPGSFEGLDAVDLSGPTTTVQFATAAF